MNNIPSSEIHDNEEDIKGNIYTTEGRLQDQGKSLAVKKTTKSGSYQAVVLPNEAKLNDAQKRLSQVFQGIMPYSSAIVFYPTPLETKENSEDVTEEFVQEFNSHRGNQELLNQANRLLLKTRKLGGLEPDSNFIDIPSARRNFFLLAKLNNQDLKISALNNLISVLDRDPVTKQTAFNLIELGIDLLKHMDRELMQTQLIDEQTIICKAYGMVAELILWHYRKKHIGGITKELKAQLISSVKTLEDLNTQDNKALHFAAIYALEGFKRLKDDKKELFELAERLFHLVIGIIEAAESFEGHSSSDWMADITLAFKDINIQIKQSWFDSALLFNDLVKNAHHNSYQLIALEIFIKDCWKELNWKFLYNCLQKLGDIAIHGSSPEIRQQAFRGDVSKSIPGLVYFANCRQFKTTTSTKPMVHFKFPKEKDNNIYIRFLTVQQLIRISQFAPDASVKMEAKQALIFCMDQEDDESILKILRAEIPLDFETQIDWTHDLDDLPMDSDHTFVLPMEKDSIVTVKKLAGQILKTNKSPIKSPNKSPNKSRKTKRLSKKVMSHSADSLTSKITPKNPSSNSKSSSNSPSTPRNTISTLHQETVSLSHTHPVPIQNSNIKKTKRLSDRSEFSGAKQAKLLAKCLGIDVDKVQQFIEFNQDIHLSEENKLYMTKAGMQKILQVISKVNYCTTLDFRHCQIQTEGLILLVENLPKFKNVTSLFMPKELNQEVGLKLAELFKNEIQTKIMFEEAKDDFFFGNLLVNADFVSDGIEYYNSSIDKIKNTNADKGLKKQVYYHLAQAFLLQEEYKDAEWALLEAYKLDSKDYNILIKLVKHFYERSDYLQAGKYAEEARKVVPSTSQENEIIKLAIEHYNS